MASRWQPLNIPNCAVLALQVLLFLSSAGLLEISGSKGSVEVGCFCPSPKRMLGELAMRFQKYIL